MTLKPVDTVESIGYEDFQKNYFRGDKPIVIKGLAKKWPAYTKWTWEYLKEVAGDRRVALYNNIKSDAYTPINTADEYMLLRDYLDMLARGPVALRIFAYNIFKDAPQLRDDFQWPKDLCSGFYKFLPFLFTGGSGSITHMHYDMDYPQLFTTQFIGRKRVLLFPHSEKNKLYLKPWDVLCEADYSNYNSNPDLIKKYPALEFANGYEVILEHGDTLFMPSGYFHHMEYIESGFALTLRVFHPSITRKLHGLWNVTGQRNIDTLFKKTIPLKWYAFKRRKVLEHASKEIQKASLKSSGGE